MSHDKPNGPGDKPGGPSDFRKSVDRSFNLLMCLSWPLRALMTVPGTMGHREARSVNGAIGLGLLVLWAALARSEALLYGGTLLGLIALADHRRLSGRDRGVHSFAMGSSRLARRLGERGGRWVEAALAVVAGLLVRGEDVGLGNYLILAGAGHAWTVGFVYAREAAVRDDLADAALEGMARAGRQPNRPPLF